MAAKRKKAVKRTRKAKAKRKADKPTLIAYKLHCPIFRFKLKNEKIVAFSESLKELYVTCH